MKKLLLSALLVASVATSCFADNGFRGNGGAKENNAEQIQIFTGANTPTLTCNKTMGDSKGKSWACTAANGNAIGKVVFVSKGKTTTCLSSAVNGISTKAPWSCTSQANKSAPSNSASTTASPASTASTASTATQLQ